MFIVPSTSESLGRKGRCDLRRDVLALLVVVGCPPGGTSSKRRQRDLAGDERARSSDCSGREEAEALTRGFQKPAGLPVIAGGPTSNHQGRRGANRLDPVD